MLLDDPSVSASSRRIKESKQMIYQQLVRCSWLALGLFTWAAFIGCSSEGPQGTVSGTVTLNGEPVKEGLVSFMSSQGHASQGKIAAGGAYTLETPLPPGEYMVSVGPPPITEAPGGLMPGQEGKESDPASHYAAQSAPQQSDIPTDYWNEVTSGLKVTVKEGANQVPIELKKS